MKSRYIVGVVCTIIAGIFLYWSTWISNSVLLNCIAIAETKQELKTEIKSMSKTLDIHYSLLKEIRDNQTEKRNTK
jgi:hypothetical protein